ncbi:MAG: MOSC domain-containing protein [Methylotetracoccus sp.]
MSQQASASVASIWRYPVKSMMGEELNASAITGHGLVGDRVYALVDHETGKVVSAKNPKKWPDLFAYRAAYVSPPNATRATPIWLTLPDGRIIRSDANGVDQILSAAIARAVNLRTKAPETASLEQYWPEREGEAEDVTSEAVAGDAPRGTFFDYAMVHLLTTSTIDALRGSYPEGRFEVRRFRPNLVVSTPGQEGFVENDWVGKVLQIGQHVRLQVTDPCPRCVMPTLAQGDLPQDAGIFKQGIMQNNVFVPFADKALPSIGVYAKVLVAGTVRRGDSIAFIE